MANCLISVFLQYCLIGSYLMVTVSFFIIVCKLQLGDNFAMRSETVGGTSKFHNKFFINVHYDRRKL